MKLVNIVLIILASSVPHTTADSCPTHEALLARCFCQSSLNGILLDCSHTSFNETIQILRSARQQLGLIQELVLKNTSVVYLPSRTFEGFFVKKLDLSQSAIADVDPQAFRGLENILQILYLRQNKLREIPTEALTGLSALLQLDLSNNSIGPLGADVFVNLPKLYELNLSNNLICKIHKDAFKNVKQLMQTLNIGGNCLAKVPAPALRGFQQLLALHLHKNQIPMLEPLQFMNMPQLYLMNLAGNEIQKIHRQAFLNTPNLKYLYLGDNHIEEIEAYQFRPFENLELLDLSRNRLVFLRAGAFSDMGHLAQLYLTGNAIETIEGNAFSNSSLVILLLNENRLRQMTAEMLYGLGSVQQFSLRDNQINFLAQNAFYQMPSLVVLDLSRNNISSLYPATFLAQLSLFMLDLSYNKLASVPYNAFNQRIATVVLQENPLVCTERVHILQSGVGIFIPGTADSLCRQNVPFLQQPVSNAVSAPPPETPAFALDQTAGAPLAPSGTNPEIFAVGFTQGPVLLTFPTSLPVAKQTPYIPELLPPNTQDAGPHYQPLPPQNVPAFVPPQYAPSFNRPAPGPFDALPGGLRPVAPVLLTAASTIATQTLPPSILLGTPNDAVDQPSLATRQPPSVDPNLPSGVRTLAPKKAPSIDTALAESGGVGPITTFVDQSSSGTDSAASQNSLNSSSLSTTTTVAVCITVVIIVVLVVFITLCVVRYRTGSSRSSSDSKKSESTAASRTSAYVAAQAARYAAANAGMYGNGTYARESLPRPSPKGTATIATAPQTSSWMYAPVTSAYAATSTYYKSP